MTVSEIVEQYIRKNNYDGLFNPGVCSCKLGDLEPCGNADTSECEAGYLYKEDGDEFTIGREKK